MKNTHKQLAKEEKVNKKASAMRVPGWAIGICIGVICLGLGVFHEQFADIYQKAVLICLECIGIG